MPLGVLYHHPRVRSASRKREKRDISMNKRCRITLAIVSALLSVRGSAHAQRLSPDIIVSNPQVYEVTITSRFVVPEEGRNVTALRVWHGLPTPRPWDGLDRTSGASAIEFEPSTGVVQYVAHNGSQNVNWNVCEGLKPGNKLEFKSRFRVRSVDRAFDPKRSEARWSDYQENLDHVAPPIDKHLDPVIDQIKKDHPPAEAALEFCKWVTANIKYDATVPYGPRDLRSILTHRKGHCGHQMTLFEAMCVRAGIPTRTVVGLNLITPGGKGALHGVRPDFENQHTWAQVFIPGSGWIEIDPGMGAKAYFLPAQVIQNNTDFQNYVVWVRERGRWILAEWENRDGQWNSPYGIENHRTFRMAAAGRDDPSDENATSRSRE
jgi:transglutaminase-like putative cysteine protease